MSELEAYCNHCKRIQPVKVKPFGGGETHSCKVCFLMVDFLVYEQPKPPTGETEEA